MSEEAKLAYLQEKIKEARKNVRSGNITFAIGVIAVVAYVLLAQFNPSSYSWILLVMGLILGAWGIIEMWRSYGQYHNLMEQLRRMAIVTATCPNCRKELPKGDFAFCPFCGTSLKS